MDFLKLRKELIKKDFSGMNDRQFEAVTTVNGPLLVLAGAGSGKTTVLVNRIANIVKYGNAYESDFVPPYGEDDIAAAQDYLNGLSDELCSPCFCVDAPRPYEILAITFTNKAANELKERICKKLGETGNDIWAGTFHSVCGKILRRNADRIGYSSHFTIYDTDDQKRLMKGIMKSLNTDEKMFPIKSVLSRISNAKDSLISPAEYESQAGYDIRIKTTAQLYREYQKQLKANDAMDFDDMISKTVELFNTAGDVLEYYQRKFKYIMVDEYQDTNHAQYELVRLLSGAHRNLCVVGDDDQSIYRFRGATIENILSFEDTFKDARVIRLEQNYRSKGNILNTANGIISHNKGRKGKTLWTDRGDGELIDLHTSYDEKAEASYVAEKILKNVQNGGSFSDNAVLYRMNAQSAPIENVFTRSGISYSVVGGHRFYDRMEIKDITSYFCVINNKNDDLRLRRIINTPKRGIGNTTVDKAAEIAQSLSLSLYEVLKNAEDYPVIAKASARLKSFFDMIDPLIAAADSSQVSELARRVVVESGYRDALLAEDTDEARDRIANIEQLISNVADYEQQSDEPSLSEFLEEVALINDIDSLNSTDDRVVMMTIHSAKGLEFENVFIVGMEEGIFPGMQCVYSDPSEIEEERRLAYVAVTRAKKTLTVTNCYTRMLYGQTARNLPSRFIQEMPVEYLNISSDNTSPFAQPSGYSGAFSGRGYSGGGYKSGSAFGSSVKVSQPIKKPSAASSYIKKIPQKSEKTCAFVQGQRVLHPTFGEGLVIKASPMGSDTLLEIAFDNVGTKKLMANFAKLKSL